jgi:hypothetical protein
MHKNFDENSEKRPLSRSRRRLDNVIKMNVNEMWCDFRHG